MTTLKSMWDADDEKAKLRVDNERLRAALAFIADRVSDPALVAVADAALEPKP